MKQETITNKLLTRNLWSVVFVSLSIRTDGKDLSGSKSNSVVLVKSPMGSASAFPFLCY